jgi:hypothetical protein
MNWKLSSVCCAGLEKEPAFDLGCGAGRDGKELTKGSGEKAALSASQHIGWNRVHFHHPRAE